ncbi:MAG: tetratricopeptide repeat protein, partial [Prolixibacteraceae bacterium]|nr:tetratricopeptide repeat protein [Prolixibacteraceae bacterium]
GFEKYPDDGDLLTEMINIYLQTKKSQEALKYLELALQKDPGNPIYYFIEGRLKDELGDQEAAITSYKKSLELNDKYFNSYYNLGALYFNKGVEQHEIALQVPPNENEKYEAELAKCDQWWDKALPPMEKCLALINDGTEEVDAATKRSVLETLKNIYYRMIPRDEATWKAKYDEMNDAIKNM